MDQNLTAYCGICCADCIPANSELHLLTEQLEKLLGKLQFDVYADYKAERIPEFRSYPVFLAILRRIGQLHCPTCRQGGGNAQCDIRSCLQARDLPGCWVCNLRPGCNRLDRLRAVHPHLDQNLDLIARLGPEQWFKARKGHYRWQ